MELGQRLELADLINNAITHAMMVEKFRDVDAEKCNSYSVLLLAIEQQLWDDFKIPMPTAIKR